MHIIKKIWPKCAVVGGNPTKVLKYRNLERYELLKNGKAFYIDKKD